MTDRGSGQPAELSLHGVQAGYGDVAVLRGVDLVAEPGKIVALIGRNGAGKTTTLRAIAGFNAATKGRILLDGTDLRGLKPFTRVRRGIGYVQEGKRIFRGLTVEENLILGTLAVRLSRRARSAAVDRALERFPMLLKKRRDIAGSLSGGQQQMLAIAQALLAEPSVLLLDEPAVGLAPAIVSDVLDVTRGLRDEGLTVVLVEQAVDRALSIADSVVVLNLGRSIYHGPPRGEELDRAINAAYLGSRSSGGSVPAGTAHREDRAAAATSSEKGVDE